MRASNSPLPLCLVAVVVVDGGLLAKSCQTLSDPRDCSPPGSSVHGIFRARTLAWLPFPSPGDLPDPGIKPGSPPLQVDSLPPAPPGRPHYVYIPFNQQIHSREATDLHSLVIKDDIWSPHQVAGNPDGVQPIILVSIPREICIMPDLADPQIGSQNLVSLVLHN